MYWHRSSNDGREVRARVRRRNERRTGGDGRLKARKRVAVVWVR